LSHRQLGCGQDGQVPADNPLRFSRVNPFDHLSKNRAAWGFGRFFFREDVFNFKAVTLGESFNSSIWEAIEATCLSSLSEDLRA